MRKKTIGIVLAAVAAGVIGTGAAQAAPPGFSKWHTYDHERDCRDSVAWMRAQGTTHITDCARTDDGRWVFWT